MMSGGTDPKISEIVLRRHIKSDNVLITGVREKDIDEFGEIILGALFDRFNVWILEIDHNLIEILKETRREYKTIENWSGIRSIENLCIVARFTPKILEEIKRHPVQITQVVDFGKLAHDYRDVTLESLHVIWEISPAKLKKVLNLLENEDAISSVPTGSASDIGRPIKLVNEDPVGYTKIISTLYKKLILGYRYPAVALINSLAMPLLAILYVTHARLDLMSFFPLSALSLSLFTLNIYYKFFVKLTAAHQAHQKVNIILRGWSAIFLVAWIVAGFHLFEQTLVAVLLGLGLFFTYLFSLYLGGLVAEKYHFRDFRLLSNAQIAIVLIAAFHHG